MEEDIQKLQMVHVRYMASVAHQLRNYNNLEDELVDEDALCIKIMYLNKDAHKEKDLCREKVANDAHLRERLVLAAYGAKENLQAQSQTLAGNGSRTRMGKNEQLLREMAGGPPKPDSANYDAACEYLVYLLEKEKSL